jgi:hypothetical protein
VNQDGEPRRKLQVATYSAPRPLLPGKPTFVTASRKGTKLVIRWGSSVRAKAYKVDVRVNDRRRIDVASSGHQFVVRQFFAWNAAAVTVAGADHGGRFGPVARTAIRRR